MFTVSEKSCSKDWKLKLVLGKNFNLCLTVLICDHMTDLNNEEENKKVNLEQFVLINYRIILSHYS